MALDFAPGNRVDIAASATLNNLTQCTQLIWIWFDSFVTNSGIYDKGAGAARKQLILPDPADQLASEVRTVSSLIRATALFSAFTPVIATGKWICLATQYDVAVGASAQKIFAGDLHDGPCRAVVLREPGGCSGYRVG